MSFGNNLKKIRQEHDMTQEELAKKINTSRSNIANYENDKNMPSIEVLNKLSEILNCSTDYLLGKSDIRNPEKIDENKLNIAFSSGFDGLNDTNKSIISATIAGLLAKQKEEEKNKDNKNNEVKK